MNIEEIKESYKNLFVDTEIDFHLNDAPTKKVENLKLLKRLEMLLPSLSTIKPPGKIGIEIFFYDDSIRFFIHLDSHHGWPSMNITIHENIFSVWWDLCMDTFGLCDDALYEPETRKLFSNLIQYYMKLELLTERLL